MPHTGKEKIRKHYPKPVKKLYNPVFLRLRPKHDMGTSSGRETCGTRGKEAMFHRGKKRRPVVGTLGSRMGLERASSKKWTKAMPQSH